MRFLNKSSNVHTDKEFDEPQSDHAPYAGGDWLVPYINLSEKIGTSEEDTRNTIRVLNEQFGSTLVDYNAPVFEQRSFAGLAQLYEDEIDGKLTALRPTIQAQSIDINRNLMTRLMAHEIQHAFIRENPIRDGDEMVLLQLNSNFLELVSRIRSRIPKIQDILRRRTTAEDHYCRNSSEVLARVRAYQIFLEQLESFPEAFRKYAQLLTDNPDEEVDLSEILTQDEASSLSLQQHEFIEIFRPTDLKWLDYDYLQRSIEGLELPKPTRNIGVINISNTPQSLKS